LADWRAAGRADGAQLPPAPLAQAQEDGRGEGGGRDREERGRPEVMHHQGTECHGDREDAEAGQQQQASQPAQQVRRGPALENSDHDDVTESVHDPGGGQRGADQDDAAEIRDNGEEQRLGQVGSRAHDGGPSRPAALAGGDGAQQRAGGESGDQRAVTRRARVQRPMGQRRDRYAVEPAGSQVGRDGDQQHELEHPLGAEQPAQRRRRCARFPGRHRCRDRSSRRNRPGRSHRGAQPHWGAGLGRADAGQRHR
jgi:hypothetical protein